MQSGTGTGTTTAALNKALASNTVTIHVIKPDNRATIHFTDLSSRAPLTDEKYPATHPVANAAAVASSSPEDKKSTSVRLEVLDEKGDVVEALPHFVPSYLVEFVEAQIAKLEAKYKKTRIELEQILAEHPWIYRKHYALKFCDNASNFLYLPFLLGLNGSGFAGTVSTISPGTATPDWVSLSVGTPASTADAVSWGLMFSVHMEAVKEALDEIFRPPLAQRISVKMDYLCEDPEHALVDAAEYSINESILLIVNGTAVMTEIIGLSAPLSTLPLWAQAVIDPFVLYFGIRFMTTYNNDDYYAGYKFWKDWIKLLLGYQVENPSPSSLAMLVDDIKRLPLVAKASFLAWCGVLTRVFPLYWYIDVASAAYAEQQFGFSWMLPPPETAAFVGVQALVMRYPNTFLNCHQNYIQSQQLLEKYFGKELEVLLASRGVPPDAIPVEKRNALYKIRKILESDVLEEMGQAFFLKQDATSLLPISYKACMGGFLSSSAMAMATTSMPLIGTAAAVGSALFLLWEGFAERQRIMDDLVCDRLLRAERTFMAQQLTESFDKVAKDAKDAKAEVDLNAAASEMLATINNTRVRKPIKTLATDATAQLTENEEKGADYVSIFLNSAGGIAGFISIMGMLRNLSEGEPELFIAFVTLVAMEQAIAGYVFNRDKIHEGVRGAYVATKLRVQSMYSLFADCKTENCLTALTNCAPREMNPIRGMLP